jgi:hypothetical protein
LGSWFSATGSGPDIFFIRDYHLRHQVDEKLTMRRFQARQQPFLSSKCSRKQPFPGLLSERSAAKHPYPPIRTVGQPFDQAFCLELIYQSTGVRFVDADDSGEAALIDLRMVVDDRQNRPLRQRHIFVRECFRHDGGRDHLQPADQIGRHVTIRRRSRFHSGAGRKTGRIHRFTDYHNCYYHNSNYRVKDEARRLFGGCPRDFGECYSARAELKVLAVGSIGASRSDHQSTLRNGIGSQSRSLAGRYVDSWALVGPCNRIDGAPPGMLACQIPS